MCDVCVVCACVCVCVCALRVRARMRVYAMWQMGADKFENESLIEWGHNTDVWFHVDKLSSAHVYLRLPIEAAPDCDPIEDPSCYMDRIPDATIEDMCQLVKANSIEGCKKASVRVVYTPWANLHKDSQTMQTGAVGFHDPKLRRYRTVTKNRETVKRLEKSKAERFPDLQRERRDYDSLHVCRASREASP